MNSLSASLRLIPERYPLLTANASLTQSDADKLVGLALPMAQAALANDIVTDDLSPLPVKAIVIDSLEDTPFGLFMGAWPTRGSKGVEIYSLPNWGFFLALLEASLEAIKPSTELEKMVMNRSRIWIGIMNDVLQCFVNDPPKGTYSMIRHHALMLLSATLWLPDDWQRAWFGIYEASAQWAQSHWTISGSLDTFLWTIETQAFEAFRKLAALSVSQSDWKWIEDFSPEIGHIFTYFQATCVAVAPLSREYHALSPVHRIDWIHQMVMHHHASEQFNLAGIGKILHLS